MVEVTRTLVLGASDAKNGVALPSPCADGVTLEQRGCSGLSDNWPCTTLVRAELMSFERCRVDCDCSCLRACSDGRVENTTAEAGVVSGSDHDIAGHAQTASKH